MLFSLFNKLSITISCLSIQKNLKTEKFILKFCLKINLNQLIQVNIAKRKLGRIMAIRLKNGRQQNDQAVSLSIEERGFGK